MSKKLIRSIMAVVLAASLLAGCKGSADASSSSGASEGSVSDPLVSEDVLSDASKDVSSDAFAEADSLGETVESQEGGDLMQVVTDSIGREVKLPDPVTKAVVANAYNTEIINAIDALDCVIGVDYNIYQDKESWKNRYTEDMVIGKSQKDLNYEKIVELAPEVLILTGNGTWEEAQRQLEPFGSAATRCRI